MEKMLWKHLGMMKKERKLNTDKETTKQNILITQPWEVALSLQRLKKTHLLLVMTTYKHNKRESKSSK